MHCCCLVTKSCKILCDPMDCNAPGFTCPSPSSGVYSNSYPLSQWYHLTISSSAMPLFCLQSFPASVSFPMSHFFASGGQSVGDSASASVLPMNVQGWFPLRLSGFISCCPKDSLESSSALHSKASILQCSAFFYCPALTSIHGYWKNHGFDYTDCYWQSDVSAF